MKARGAFDSGALLGSMHALLPPFTESSQLQNLSFSQAARCLYILFFLKEKARALSLD
jgi:hypothetical protein